LYHAAPFTPATAGKLAAVAIASIYVLQLLLAQLGLVAAIVADALVIAGVLAYAQRRQVRAADLGFRRTRTRFLVAAVLIGLSMWYLTAWLVVLIEPPGDVKALESFVKSTSLALTLVGLTIFPALAEELVFRGILARSLVHRFGTPAAIAISAAVFGLYHLNPPQIVSTFALGLVLAFLTLRASSIIPAIIVHVLNNTIAIVLPRNELPRVGDWITANPGPMFAATILCVTCGVLLAAKGAA
jgi:membrane protease YdiL (CAAX protease family)